MRNLIRSKIWCAARIVIFITQKVKQSITMINSFAAQNIAVSTVIPPLQKKNKPL